MSHHPYQPILQLTRGGTVESIHYGALAIVDNQGRLIASHGDPEAVTFLRSSAKPFQLIPFIENGGPEAYNLSLKEIAVMCASHSGTDEHVETIQGIQQKAEISESELLCGVHPPIHAATAKRMRERGEEPTSNRHNCSGKHTGMLAFTRLKGLSAANTPGKLPYIDPGHPIQQEILKTFAEMCDVKPEQIALGVDGCSAPVFAVPMKNAALAFARLCDPSELTPKRAAACRMIVKAMTSHPNMVGGPDSFDTHLMEATKGRIVIKGGAEGYQAFGLLPGALSPGSPALGVTLKVSDGDLGVRARSRDRSTGHVRPAVTLEVLRQLGALSEEEMAALADYGPIFKLHNWQRIEIGEARPLVSLDLKDFNGGG